MQLSIQTALQRYRLDRETLYDLVDQGEVRLYLRDRDGDLACDGYEPAGAGLVALSSERADVYVTLFFDGQDMTDLITLAPYNGRPLPPERDLRVLAGEIEKCLSGTGSQPVPDGLITNQNSTLADKAAAILEEETQRRDDWSEPVQSMIVESIRRTGRIPKTPGDVLQSLPDDISRLGVEISGRGSRTRYRNPDATEPLSHDSMSKRLTARLKKLARLAGC